MTASEILSPETGGFSGKPHSHGASPVPGDSRGERRRSFELADFDVPTGREEEWRFTPLDRLRHLHEDDGAGTGTVIVEVDAAPEVTVEAVARGDARLGRGGEPADRVAARAWNAFEKATVITVPSEAVASREPTVSVRGTGVDDGAPSVTCSSTCSRSPRPSWSWTTPAGDLRRQRGVRRRRQCTADRRRGQRLGRRHGPPLAAVGAHRAGRQVQGIVVDFGGDVARVSSEARFAGPGGEIEMLGLYFADADQHLEHRLFVDHAVPHCKSNVVYKGALQGEEAHTVWIGDVLIRAEAEGTETYELNRNLVLTDGARADSVPNLEIETGEIVGAGHASATGRFDDEQLFYLQSRGIPENEARRLVVRGFFADVINKIGIPEVRDRLLRRSSGSWKARCTEWPTTSVACAAPTSRTARPSAC